MDLFLARQPIFGRYREVFGYELLFRSGWENAFRGSDLNQASLQVMSNSFHVFGLNELTGKHAVFINVTRDVLLSEFLTLLPPERTVVEILEDIKPDPEVLETCRNLKRRGFRLALDDFVFTPGLKPLMDLADLIKVDVIQSTVEQQRSLLNRPTTSGLRFIAEKVETHDVFHRCAADGFTFFQGYFFARPEVLSKRAITGQKAQYLQILNEIHKSSLDLSRLEDILKHDLSLSYKLMRYINSAHFGWKVEIRSLRHAVVLMGENDFRKWVSLVVLAGMATDKPAELVLNALIRARFCELLAPLVGLSDKEQDLFLLGLFSRLDAILDQPLADCLADIPITPQIKGAFFDQDNSYRQVYQLLEIYEKGQNEKIKNQAVSLGMDQKDLPPLYWKAVAWAEASIPTSS
jgi:c-di-GMP-related signal transduction protein